MDEGVSNNRDVATPADAAIAAPEDTTHALLEMGKIAIPAVVTMTSYTIMQFVDTWIVAPLGPGAIAAVGQGAVAAFVPAAVIFGAVSVVNTFVSQNLGAGTPEEGAAYAWNGVWLNVLAWLVAFIPLAVFFPQLYELMRAAVGVAPPDAEVIRMETLYGRILLLGMVATACARGMSHYFFGMHRPGIVMVAAVVANLVNVGLSYMLVRGALGAPEMGVAGAAIATVICGVLEVAILMVVFLSPKYQDAYGTRSCWRPALDKMRDLLRIGWPAAAMWGVEVFCWWVFMGGFLPHFDKGQEAAVSAASGQIAMRYMHLSFMPAVGFSIALSAIVGKYVGARRFDLAARRTWQGLGLTLAYMGLCAMVFILAGESLAAVFAPPVDAGQGMSEETRLAIITLTGKVLIVAAAFQLFDATVIALSGALRGAGDTVWPGLVSVVATWVIMIGGGWIVTHKFNDWGPLGPWVAAASYIALTALLMLWRFASGRWKTKAVAGYDPEAARSALETIAEPAPAASAHVEEPKPASLGLTADRDAAGDPA